MALRFESRTRERSLGDSEHVERAKQPSEPGSSAVFHIDYDQRDNFGSAPHTRNGRAAWRILSACPHALPPAGPQVIATQIYRKPARSTTGRLKELTES